MSFVFPYLLLNVQLLKHQNFVITGESFLVQFATSQIVVVTLLMVYSYFFADEVRWMSYYGILTPPLLLLIFAMRNVLKF